MSEKGNASSSVYNLKENIFNSNHNDDDFKLILIKNQENNKIKVSKSNLYEGFHFELIIQNISKKSIKDFIIEKIQNESNENIIIYPHFFKDELLPGEKKIMLLGIYMDETTDKQENEENEENEINIEIHAINRNDQEISKKELFKLIIKN